MNFKFYLSFFLIAGMFVSCDEEGERHPDIKTIAITPLSAANFLLKGSFTEVGSIPVVEYGFVYSLGGAPTVEYDPRIVMGKNPQKGPFEYELILPSQSGYYGGSVYARAFITNERGTAYGAIVNVLIPELIVTSVSPLVARQGEQVTIKGLNFGTTPDLNKVYFNQVPATIIASTSNSLDVIVPEGITQTYYGSYIQINVHTGGQQVNATQNFVMKPSVSSFSPASGTFGTSVTINGSFYVPYYYYSSDYSVTVGGVNSGINSMSSTTISFTIPHNLNQTNPKIVLNYLGHEVEVGTFAMEPLIVTSISCTEVFGNSYVTIYGSGFNSGYYYPNDYNKVKIGGQSVSLYSVTPTEMGFYVPTNLSSGIYSIDVSNSLETVVLTDELTVDELEVTGTSSTTIKLGNRFEVYGNFSACGFTFSPSLTLNGYGLYITKITDSSIEVEVPSWMPVGTFQLMLYHNNESIIVANEVQITN